MANLLQYLLQLLPVLNNNQNNTPTRSQSAPSSDHNHRQHNPNAASSVVDMSEFYGCFDVWENSVGICLPRNNLAYHPISLPECLRKCNSYGLERCKALDYDHGKCLIYNVTVHVPPQYDSRVSNVRGSTECQFGWMAKVVPHAGSAHFRATGMCAPTTTTQWPFTHTSTHRPHTTRAPPSLTTTTTTPATTTTTQNTGEGCESWQLVRFTWHPEMTVPMAPNQIEIELDTPDECLRVCRDNTLPWQDKIKCTAVTYHADTKNCAVYETNNVNNPTAVQDSVGTDLFVKQCVDTPGVRKGCHGPYPVFHDYMLNGDVHTVINATSFIECLMLCLDSELLFGSPCNSGMYFHNETTYNCALTADNSKTHPNDMIDSPNSNILYFETNCMNDDEKVPKTGGGDNSRSGSGQWTEWSRCTSPTSSRSRHWRCMSDGDKHQDCNKIETQSCKGVMFDLNKFREFLSRGATSRCNPLKSCCARRSPNGEPDCDNQGIHFDDSFRTVACYPMVDC